MVHPETGKSQEDSRDKKLDPYVKTRSRVLRAGFGSASADKFLSESVRILAERLKSSSLTEIKGRSYLLFSGTGSHHGCYSFL